MAGGFLLAAHPVGAPFEERDPNQTPAETHARLAKAKEQLTKNPHSAFWHDQVAVLYSWLGDYASAEAEYRAAVRDNPNSIIDYYGLASIIERKGKRADREWEDLYRKALSLDPNNPTGLLGYALFLERKGRFKEAAENFFMCLHALDRVKGIAYIDPNGAAYSFNVEAYRDEAAAGLKRVEKTH